jgi:chromosome partitioning protein
MYRVVVLNPKGGSGKTTIAINLASYYAVRDLRPVLMDYDPQGSGIRWLKKRTPQQPPIHGIAAYERNNRTTRSFHLRLPAEAQRLVIDTPAALSPHDMPELTRGADAVLVPVLPSDIDIHACSKCIADLLLVAKVRRNDNRIGVIANRVRKHTLIYQSLMRFLATLQIPIVATFRDSQNYIRGAELGVGIHEMKPYLVREDIEQWNPLVDWLESRSPQAQAAAVAAPSAWASVAGAAAVTPVAEAAAAAANPVDAAAAQGATNAEVAEETAAAAEPVPHLPASEGGSPG